MNRKWMAATLLACVVSFYTSAQTKETAKDAKKSKKDETIIVKKKAGSKEKLTIMVDGESVTVNGKPIEAFSDDNVEIIRNKNLRGYTIAGLPITPRAYAPFSGQGSFTFGGDDRYNFPLATAVSANKAVLGVLTEKDEKGVKITAVTKNSAASKAGLKEGDVITTVNDEAIAESDELYKVIGKFKPEDKVTVTYLRDGKANTITATLLKSTNAFAYSLGSNNVNFVSGKPRIGMQIQDVEEENGIKVLDVNAETPAAKAGFKENDIITQMDGKELKNVDDFRNKVKDLKEGDSMKLTYKRDGNTKTTELKIPKKLKIATL